MSQTKKNQEPGKPTLRETCDKIEEKFGYLKELSRDEIQEEIDNLAAIAVKISDLETEFKEIRVEHKAKIDPVKKDYANILQVVRSGKKWIQEDAFVFIDRDIRRAEYYNQEGILIYSRPLTLDELQFKLTPEI